MPVFEMAIHVGGKYRWSWRDENAQEFGFIGEMLVVGVHSKLVHTQVYDPSDCDFGSMGGEMSYQSLDGMPAG